LLVLVFIPSCVQRAILVAAALACAITGETPVPPFDCELILGLRSSIVSNIKLKLGFYLHRKVQKEAMSWWGGRLWPPVVLAGTEARPTIIFMVYG
jgi:hypothetical protein